MVSFAGPRAEGMPPATPVTRPGTLQELRVLRGVEEPLHAVRGLHKAPEVHGRLRPLPRGGHGEARSGGGWCGGRDTKAPCSGAFGVGDDSITKSSP